jgi:hypothetical protein
VRFRATSGEFVADSDVTTVSIAVVVVNADPVWVTAANLGTIPANTPFSFPLTASDPESNAINFTVGALPGASTATPQTQSGASRAIVVAGTGLSAGTYTFTIDADDEPPLGQVTGLVAMALSSASIGLTWTAVSNATGYQVERSFTGTGNWTVLGTVSPNNYTSTGLAPETLYFYRVRALSATQTGEYSAAASGTTMSAATAATQDWQSRIVGAMWYHRFDSQDEVTRFIKSTSDPTRVLWAPSGGPNDVGYLRCINPAGDGAGSNTWDRPCAALPATATLPADPGYDPALTPIQFNAANPTSFVYGEYGHPDYWSEYPTRFHGHEFYVQMRIRVTPGRWSSAIEGGKVLWFANVNYTPGQEINYQALYDGRFAGYTAFGGSTHDRIVRSPQVAPAASVRQYWQAGGDYHVNACSTINSTADTSGCWKWPGYLDSSEWTTFLMRVKLGHNNTSIAAPTNLDSELDVWVAENGAYWPLIHRTDAHFVYDSGRPKGLQSLRCSAFFNGEVFAEAWEQDFAEIIFSTAWIPPPAAGL